MIRRDQLLNDSQASLRAALNGWQSSMWTAIPCIVVSVDYEAMTMVAQPAIQGEIDLPDGTTQTVNLPLLLDVPIVYPGAGDFIITFPIAAMDEVLVVFASRCIDSWWQSGVVSPPMEYRMHDLSDGFAIPGPRSQPNTVPDISETEIQVRNKAGTAFISIDEDGKIKLTSPDSIEITGDVTVTGDVTADGISLKTHTHSVSVPATPFTGNTGAPA